MQTRIKIARVFIYLILSIIIAQAIIYYVLLGNGLLEGKTYIGDIFSVISTVFIFVWAIILAWYLQTKSIFKQLLIDNVYYFNKQCFFYNGYLLQNTIKKNIKHKKVEGYVISFIGCGQNSSNSLIRNDLIAEFNYYLSIEVSKYFEKGTKYYSKYLSYGFYKDSFIIFIDTDEDTVNKIIKDFEETIYQISRDHDFKLLVQPFFGVAKYDKSTTVLANMENAALARHNSEKHFELASYFNSELQYSYTAEETKEMLEAIQNKEFVVYYQPKFNLNKRMFTSTEALIRWNSPKYGLLSPSRFITKAEAAGLIHDLDVLVFQTVCKDLKELKMRAKRMLPVSINFSLYEFYSPNFIQYILSTIDGYGIPRNLIEIEITETTTQANSFLCISVIKKLRDEGIRILMDDFGIGYSNFNNLRKMPIDAIKIDKAFIDDIVVDAKTRNIVGFLINLGTVNGLEVIAEGVDNKDQVEILRRLKLDTIQGFYYSKPLPKKELEIFLKENQFEIRGERPYDFVSRK